MPYTMCADNDHLLTVAWWVILNSSDLFAGLLRQCFISEDVSEVLFIPDSTKLGKNN